VEATSDATVITDLYRPIDCGCLLFRDEILFLCTACRRQIIKRRPEWLNRTLNIHSRRAHFILRRLTTWFPASPLSRVLKLHEWFRRRAEIVWRNPLNTLRSTRHFASPHCAKNRVPLSARLVLLFVRARFDSFSREVRAMFHLVYASSAAKLFTTPELKALLDQARQKNARLNVTGMLLYKDGNFMQVLEGEQKVVTKLAGNIELDHRHKGVLVLLRGTSEQHLFPDWSMGFRDLTDQNTEKTPGYNDFLNTPLTDATFSHDPARCMKLLLLFKKNM
jgi:hypothetical protein